MAAFNIFFFTFINLCGVMVLHQSEAYQLSERPQSLKSQSGIVKSYEKDFGPVIDKEYSLETAPTRNFLSTGGPGLLALASQRAASAPNLKADSTSIPLDRMEIFVKALAESSQLESAPFMPLELNEWISYGSSYMDGVSQALKRLSLAVVDFFDIIDKRIDEAGGYAVLNLDEFPL